MSETLETLLDESRTFPPSDAFRAQANINDPGIYERAAADPVKFWEEQAEALHWFERWHTALEWNRPYAKWFVGGKLNACYNCVDRHAEGPRADKIALLFEGEPGDIRKISFRELKDEVSQTANALKSLGVKKGDRVCIYMPMVAELAITMLACARIGAAHSVVFGGFSADSLAERTNDAEAKVIVTADGGWRRGHVVPLKKITDEALDLGCPTVEKVLVLNRVGEKAPEGTTMTEGRDVWWHEVVPQQSKDCPCEPMDSEDLLYILYTSGSTGKPKGIVHTTGGYLTQTTATTKWVFDLKENDVYWCTADCGWVTGHSYIVYGPLSNGATCVVFEGAPDSPDKDRFWKIVENHKVTILYTAPTAIRAFMKWGVQYPQSCDLSSLRLLGSVGEPINPEAWIWYHENIGGSRCPIVDTWWQTETGSILISPLPGLTATKPGSATQPLPGILAAIMNEEGEELYPAHRAVNEKPGEAIGGILAIKHPWPSMTRGIYGEPERFVATYWSRFKEHYFPGDGAKVDQDGYYWLLGRVDDIMLVAGHNISTMEVESALVDHHAVAEAAVIGKTHDLKGQAISAFVILKTGQESHPDMVNELKAHVAHKIGAIARPDDIFICADLPKTRSGKIMRRLLRDVAEGRALGDTTTLADPGVVNSLKNQYEDKES
ncbi:MAG: acetate--CoA ligase [Armatimonadetes bacterium 55-13]|nr:acetate--CoA ligase [Armatimonadota bacterium]ODU51978.1 MAG: acetate--CoA ligase [bacterium SCN 57-13]OJU64022.1 MAG: acetate--CoA ligase [Armatimonadetes bacterium 55-13]